MKRESYIIYLMLYQEIVIIRFVTLVSYKEFARLLGNISLRCVILICAVKCLFNDAKILLY